MEKEKDYLLLRITNKEVRTAIAEFNSKYGFKNVPIGNVFASYFEKDGLSIRIKNKELADKAKKSGIDINIKSPTLERIVYQGIKKVELEKKKLEEEKMKKNTEEIINSLITLMQPKTNSEDKKNKNNFDVKTVFFDPRIF